MNLPIRLVLVKSKSVFYSSHSTHLEYELHLAESYLVEKVQHFHIHFEVLCPATEEKQKMLGCKARKDNYVNSSIEKRYQKASKL